MMKLEDLSPDQAALLEEKMQEVQREKERGTKDWEMARQLRVELNEQIHENLVCSYCGYALNGDAIHEAETAVCPMCSRCPFCGDSNPPEDRSHYQEHHGGEE